MGISYTLTGQKQSEENDAASILYDALGRLATETSGTAVKTYEYNLADSRTSFTLSIGGTQYFNTTYTYDEMNRMVGMTEGSVIAEYGYDTNGNRSYVEHDNDIREEYSYTLDGNQVEKTEPGGKVTTYEYDGLGRLTGETVTISGVLSQSYEYEYDGYNNRVTLKAKGEEEYEASYTYDLNNRLLTETKASPDSTDSTTYFYDPNGNQIAKARESLSSGSGDEEIGLTLGVVDGEISRYNGFNQLLQISTDGTEASYAYAASGLRVSKTVNDVTNGFILDGGNVVMETLEGVPAAKYIRAINLVASTFGSTTRYYLYNGHGDVVQLADASGTVAKTYDYDAFGNEKNPDAQDPNPFRYCGEYFDKENGRYYLRARYYDSVIGRFIQQDEWDYSSPGDPLSLNLYTYVKANPVVIVDPTGHFGVPLIAVFAGVGAAVGGIIAGYRIYRETGSVDWTSVGDGLIAGAATGASLLTIGGYAAILVSLQGRARTWVTLLTTSWGESRPGRRLLHGSLLQVLMVSVEQWKW